MKRASVSVVVILLLVTAGCGGNKHSTDDIIKIDVTKSYPKKELILQDVFDVEYIALETNDEFVTSGEIWNIGKDIIIVRNRSMDEDIIIFDRKGKGLRKINRKGQGPEEYNVTLATVLDEDNNEMFVFSIMPSRMLVYDLFGNFKRRLEIEGRNDNFYLLANFDRNHLIFHNQLYRVVDGHIEGPRNQFFIMNKQDGSITKEIEIPFIEKKWTIVAAGERNTSVARNLKLIPHSNWIIAEASSDTIYSILPDYSLVPIIARTPSIQSMNPEVFLFPSIFTDRYYFMQTVKKEYNFSTRTGWPGIDLVYDRQEGAIFEYIVYNDDFLSKKSVKLSLERPIAIPIPNNEIAFLNTFEAYELVEAYKNGELKNGKLKEIASKLDEEDNRVIMIAKYKR